ncbi:Hpt protein [Pseudarthrobacter chlorophenolicus A6]|uniref:Hpt protein n=1 Tax=Pseudarthrobacter chlorophenolicus (strain ATCC 700700 / DSM 12829 / CIP 107037 / JCM 12360 / KCTC 9906 / NCIMB 13794 / A6) TaxID=452863 RepID=B8H6Z4_PSECP|nr:Hpt protein [Pseudarthrobacter chlorophenolicus]ACL39715.1 Hpt protein [Pseudarthrobacter chlorophenolicus A6]SDQ94924.1 hypothetical protein SAMN04489738_3772 [Pseudarthrobacter chlorophenolicus]
MKELHALGHPLLDSSVLDRLRDGVDNDSDIWRLFIRNYIGLLPRRIERVRLCLTSADFEGAMDSVLSLRSSSEMVGAERLAALAGHLQAALRNATEHDISTTLPGMAPAHLEDLSRCANQTKNRLLQVLS